jgi:hypothetical protein
MSSPRETFDVKLNDLIEEAASFDIQSDEATKAIRNLETFSHCRPPEPEPEPVIPEVVIPTTTWGRVKAEVSSAMDNETTRVLIKAGGTFAGVALVVWSTIHRDHVVERQALAQANQRS